MDLTNYFVSNPCTIISISLLILIIFTIIAFGHNLFEINQNSGRDYLIWSDPIVMDYDKKTVAEEYVKSKQTSGLQPVRVETVSDWNAILLYDGSTQIDYPDVGVFNKKTLLEIEANEKMIKNMERYE